MIKKRGKDKELPPPFIKKPKRVSLNKAIDILTWSAVSMYSNFCRRSYCNNMAQPSIAEIHEWDFKSNKWIKIIVVHGNGDWSQTRFGSIIAVDRSHRLYYVYDTNSLYTRRWRWPEDLYSLDMFMWTDGYSCPTSKETDLWVWHLETCSRCLIDKTRSEIKKFLIESLH